MFQRALLVPLLLFPSHLNITKSDAFPYLLCNYHQRGPVIRSLDFTVHTYNPDLVYVDNNAGESGMVVQTQKQFARMN